MKKKNSVFSFLIFKTTWISNRDFVQNWGEGELGPETLVIGDLDPT